MMNYKENLIRYSKNELGLILENHRLWLDSSCEFGVQANLSFCDLKGMDFDYEDLRCVYICCSDVRECSFVCANLSYSKLFASDFSSSNMLSSHLVKSNLSNSNLNNCNFTLSDLTDADLSYSNSINANFDSAKLVNVKI